MTKEQRQELRAKIAAYPPGSRPRDIARDLGTNYQTVYGYFREIFPPVGGHGRRKGDRNKATVARHSMILRAIQQDPTKPLSFFAKQFEMTRQGIHAVIKAAGLPPKPHARRTS